MTRRQQQKMWAKAKRRKKRERRRAAKARKQARTDARKVKRAAKAAPRRSLQEWAADVRAVGKCAVCGIGVVPKLDKNGTQKKSKPIKKKDGTFTKPMSVFVHLNAHHLLPKERYPQFKTRAVNGICLCPLHHKRGKYSAHMNPVWFAEWLKENRPYQYRWCVRNMGAWNDSKVLTGGFGGTTAMAKENRRLPAAS